MRLRSVDFEGMSIRHENAKAGTREWMLTKTRIDPATKYRCPWIEGYCSRTSVRAGETLDFFVSTNPPSQFTIDLYRMGHYGGAGGRHVMSLGPFEGKAQPEPPVAAGQFIDEDPAERREHLGPRRQQGTQLERDG